MKCDLQGENSMKHNTPNIYCKSRELKKEGMQNE